MSLSNWPDFWLIIKANTQSELWEDWSPYYEKGYDTELESRVPVFEREYDATGQIITSEVMDYTDEGEAVWN